MLKETCLGVNWIISGMNLSDCTCQNEQCGKQSELPSKKKTIHLLLTVRRIEKETNKKNRLDVSSVTCNCHPWFKKKTA